MPRVKRGTVRATKRKRILARTKGFHWGSKNLIKAAKTSLKKAGANSFRGRKQKKRDNRALWQIQINAALREKGLTYSKFMGELKKKNIILDRKSLSDIAQNNEKLFAAIIAKVKA